MSNPYNSFFVVWLVQEPGISDWVYGASQTNNQCSPWDITISNHVLEANMPVPVLPECSADDILAYLINLDFVNIFTDVECKVTKKRRSLFESGPLNLNAISYRCRKGVYSKDL